jgi:hypothetical protein
MVENSPVPTKTMRMSHSLLWLVVIRRPLLLLRELMHPTQQGKRDGVTKLAQRPSRAGQPIE